MHNTRQSLRNAAILIDTLDPRSADALIEQMPPQQAARVRRAVMELSDVTAQEREQVVAMFVRRNGAPPATRDDGIEIDDSLAAKFAVAPQNTRPRPTVVNDTADNEPLPFRFLHEAAGDSLSSFLRHEHPQTIAVVISHLPPDRAADVLLRLPEELQAEVVRRVSHLEETDPEIVREIEREIETVLSHRVRTVKQRAAGVAAVSAILAATSGPERDRLLYNLAHADAQLAEQLTLATQLPLDELEPTIVPLPTTPDATEPQDVADNENELSIHQPAESWAFDELAELDDRSLAAVLHAANSQFVLLALTGARRGFVDRILGQLPARERKAFQKQIENTGPLRLRDVERAQQHLARLAGKLAEQGTIRVPSRRRLAAAA